MSEAGRAPILHVDLDAFYASVEQRRDPSLIGKPMVVGAGVVLAATYEARRFGIRAGIGTSRARSLCPGLIVVSGEFSAYAEASKSVFEICRRFTPLVEQISIDEAFLDVSGAARLFGSPRDIGMRLRREVREEVGLVLSVGIASTKFLAKVASRMAKPDGMVLVEPERELEFLHPLPVDVIWGVGEVTREKLAALGIHTVGDLAMMPRETLSSRLGRGSGAHLHSLAWNRDVRRVVMRRRAGSVGAQSAFGRSVTDRAGYARVLGRLADRVGGRMRAKQRAGRTITLRVRTGEFRGHTRSRSLRAPTSSTAAIFTTASRLLDGYLAAAEEPELTLLGISVSNLFVEPHLQLELPIPGLTSLDDAVTAAGSSKALELARLDRSVDEIRGRFGRESIGPAAVLLHPRGEGMVPVAFADLLVDDDSDV